MANIAIKRGNGGDATQLALPRDVLRPLHLWQDMMGWDPFAQIFPTLPEPERAAFDPSFDVKETKDAYVFTAEVPGIQMKDVDIQITENRLTISGTRVAETEEQGATTYRCERAFGSFSRAFTLPGGVDPDKVEAELKAGVLTVNVPKTAEAKTRHIPIKTS